MVLVGIDRIVAHARQLHPDVFEQYGEAKGVCDVGLPVTDLLK